MTCKVGEHPAPSLNDVDAAVKPLGVAPHVAEPIRTTVDGWLEAELNH